jgi:hypothetical protein
VELGGAPVFAVLVDHQPRRADNLVDDPGWTCFAACGRTRRAQLAADDGTRWPRFSAGGALPQVVRACVGGDWWKRLVEAEYVVRVVGSFDLHESAVVLTVVGLLPVR